MVFDVKDIKLDGSIKLDCIDMLPGKGKASEAGLLKVLVSVFPEIKKPVSNLLTGFFIREKISVVSQLVSKE